MSCPSFQAIRYERHPSSFQLNDLRRSVYCSIMFTCVMYLFIKLQYFVADCSNHVYFAFFAMTIFVILWFFFHYKTIEMKVLNTKLPHEFKNYSIVFRNAKTLLLSTDSLPYGKFTIRLYIYIIHYKIHSHYSKFLDFLNF